MIFQIIATFPTVFDFPVGVQARSRILIAYWLFLRGGNTRYRNNNPPSPRLAGTTRLQASIGSVAIAITIAPLEPAAARADPSTMLRSAPVPRRGSRGLAADRRISWVLRGSRNAVGEEIWTDDQDFAASAGGLRYVLSRRRLVREMAGPARAVTAGGGNHHFRLL